jgi:hypothetical protein
MYVVIRIQFSCKKYILVIMLIKAFIFDIVHFKMAENISETQFNLSFSPNLW